MALNYKIIQPEIGVDTTPILVFIHEALGSIGQWKNFPQELCNALGAQGIVYERQGHGESSPFSETRDVDYLYRYALDELPEFLNATLSKEFGNRINQQVFLVGHSDGGTIALLYAHKYPEHIQGLITMAAHVINEPETIAGIAPAVEAYEQGKLNGLKKYHGEKTEALFYAWANIWRNERFKDWNILQEIASPSLKGLFLQGEDDQYGTAQQLALMKNHFKGESTTILMPNCGHHPHLEQTSSTIEHIVSFYNSL